LTLTLHSLGDQLTTTDNITRCPQCATAFRVTADVLVVANGAVRCGSCLRVFNAKNYLLKTNSQVADHSTPAYMTGNDVPLSAENTPSDVETLREEQPLNASEKQRAAPPTETPTEHLHFSTHTSANDEPDESWAVELLKEAEQTEVILAEDDFHQDYDDNFLEEDTSNIDTTNNRPNHPKTHSHVQFEGATDPTESLFIDIINNDLDDNDKTTTYNFNQSLDALVDDTPRINQPNKQFMPLDGDDSWADDLLADENSSPDAVLIPSDSHAAQRSSSGIKESAGISSMPTKGEVSHKLTLGFERDSITFSEETLSKRRWPWVIGSALLIVVLLGQIAWLNLDEWGSQPAYRAYYEKACKIIVCQLPDRFDITQIRSTYLVIRSHPDRKNALLVDAIIANRALFEQPFPGIDLLFFDIQGKLVANRIFQPNEYLKGAAFGRTTMLANQSIRLSLAIADPGEKAVNYRLEVTPAAPQN
jgi:predicted Zn finger-like uncharacterized protein